MAERPKFGPLTPPPLSGAAFLAEYRAGMKGLFDAAVFPLTGIGGTANSVTASLAWDLDAGLLDGMKFCLTWAADNTGPMTLAINGAAPVNVLDATGGAMIAGAAKGGTRALIEYIAGAFRVLTGGGVSAAEQRFFWRFSSSGTWAKPAGISDDAIVTVEMWGGGGGAAGGNGGGGGGGYARREFRAADLPTSIPVNVGAGGAIGTAGGNSGFGTLLLAFGGGQASTGGGGRGGGSMEAGGSLANGGYLGGGEGGTPGVSTSRGGSATTEWGGGGGSATGTASGGRAVFGGGGGGGIAGVSKFGGDGGGSGVPGAAPGGGGGHSSPGARGEVRIWA